MEHLDKYLGVRFNEWVPIQKINSQKYLCKCSCGVEKIQYIKNIVSGSSKSCGHERNTVGKQFGNWTVIKELGKGKILCRCACGTERELYKKAVISGETKSCGCLNTSGKLDILNKRFGYLTATRFLGNALWECKCDCGNITNVYRRALLDGSVKSCGCKKSENMLMTMLNKYGDITSCKINEPREKWQIETLHDRDKMLTLIDDIREKYWCSKPTIKQLTKELDVNDSTMLKSIHELALEDKVDIGTMSSQFEDEICNWINTIKPGIIIERNNRKLLDNNRELDIYLPEYKLAIEFNRTYWHRYPTKGVKYHQDKTLECMSKDIRLIHIFEYEWISSIQQNKIKDLIQDIICSKKVLHARNLSIREISNTEAIEFANKYHLQNGVSADINIALTLNNNIVALMSFGSQRFDKVHQYELIRLCFETGVAVVGGTEKLFNYFIRTYKPNNIITYCNIAKFVGKGYKKLGFKIVGVTEPNYVWVSEDSSRVLTRYQCQKKRLVELKLGTEDETENIIMERLGYSKIYDSGNLKFEYKTSN